jgi:hypothetical protein
MKTKDMFSTAHVSVRNKGLRTRVSASVEMIRFRRRHVNEPGHKGRASLKKE